MKTLFLSHTDLLALRRKYGWMLRILHMDAKNAVRSLSPPRSEVQAPQVRLHRERLRRLAQHFPGALRELEMCAPSTIEARFQQIATIWGPRSEHGLEIRSKTLSIDAPSSRAWKAMALALAWHRRLEDLRIWRSLAPPRKRRDFSAFLQWVHHQPGSSTPFRPLAPHRWPNSPGLHSCLPGASEVLDDLALCFGYSKMELRRLLFDRPGPERS